MKMVVLPTSLDWKLGIEIELLAPKGSSRRELAQAIAANCGGRVKRFFHPQSEHSKAPDRPVFENLTLGFAVEDSQGKLFAQCVDDLTLQDDLNKGLPPQPGWYRIVSDDARLLRLITKHADPEAPLETVLAPIAKLFGTTLSRSETDMVRVCDDAGASVAIGAPLPGERERPCELITAPIESNHLEKLEDLLKIARSLNFSAPVEGAIHLHFDATKLCSAVAIANLVTALSVHGTSLRELFDTNPHCRRLGAWPEQLFDLVNSDGFVDLPWEAARSELAKLSLTKYCDYNLRNIVHAISSKHTFEARIFPIWLDADKIVKAAALFAAILNWASDSHNRKPVSDNFDRFINDALSSAPTQSR